MKYWIVPQNNEYFRLDDLLRDHDAVTWVHRNNFEVGDIVYIYQSKPARRLKYVMEVVQINAPDDDDSQYNGPKHLDKRQSSKLSVFKLLKRLGDKLNLGFYDLKANGLTNNLQSVVSIDGELLEYISSKTQDEITLEASPDYLSESDQYPEGATMQVTINKYERNRYAREVCIKAFGCKCSICGIDFVKVYGEVGKGFIHVHHIVPLSSIGKSYNLNPVEDLIPVCPNCHAMLHREINGKQKTVQELKRLFKSK